MFSSKLKDDVLNHVFRNEPYTAPTTVYVGLLTSSGEVSASGYNRQEITFAEPSDNGIKNDSEVRFPIATEDWGTVTGMAIYGEKSGGDKLDELELTGRSVGENEQPFVPVGGYESEMIQCD